MEEEKDKQKESLKSFVRSQIEERGSVPFFQFMEWCLYHPHYGYYSSERVRVGKEGDYYTGPCVHPLFGYLVAKQLRQMAQILGNDTFDVVEMGGGRGFLCQDILEWSKEGSPSFYEGLRYYLIERSAILQREQRERLSRWEKKGKVFWVPLETFEAGDIQWNGCFLSNELLDAFPVHRILFERGTLKESYITLRKGELTEEWGELSDPSIESYFKSMGVNLAEGQKTEVNLKALEWLEQVARCLGKGFVLTIDYGYSAQELYAPYRREGTLLCYSSHRTSEDFLDRPGDQDITSHVNFSALIHKGEEIGLHLTGLVPQYQFLFGLGLLEEIESWGERLSELDGLKLRLTLKHLIEPEVGMGEVFKVLVQHKGLDHPRLDGLRDLRDISLGGSFRRRDG